MHSFVVLLMRLKGRKILEVRPHRERHLGSNVCNLDFTHDQPQVFDRSDTARTAISDKTGRFVIPFEVEKIDSVLERRRGGMVVFGGDENIGVKRSNFVTPALRVRLAVLMHYGGHRLIEEWQLVILDVDNFKLRVVAA